MSSGSYFHPVSETQLYNLFDEFGASEVSVKTDVETLKEWIRKQPHLPAVEDDRWLIHLLLRCKNSLEKTKTIIEGYYTTKAMMPEAFQNRDPCTKDMETTFRFGGLIPCPKLTPTGHRIWISHIFHKSTNEIPTSASILKMIQISLDLFLKLDPNRGVIVVHNLQNFTPAYIAVVIPIVKKFLTLSMKTTPARYPQIYFVKTASFADTLIRFMRSFLPKKLNERVRLWNDPATNLANVLPADVLPVDFGGQEKSLVELGGLWYDEVKRHREWLISSEEQVADLDKEPSYVRQNNDNVEFGIEGSFRKLDVD